MQHPLTLGLIALGFLLVGGGAYFFGGGESASGFGAMLLRVGILLALVWLAWPDLAKIPWWLVGGGLVAAIVVVLIGGWTALVVAIPSVLAFWMLVPRLFARPK
jgi:hypothetical protein